ncbi:hypothetical protein ACTWQF_22650 [Streptomyces sp. 8N114]|uniref:hypothetical protein n=1 Tax=Streptomyces sp. 8N114 TaxID=3457419 RepID=UPI003FCFE225
MPTPYGSRGGVAFGPHELRVLSGALAIALQSDPAPEQAREFLRLAQAVDETIREGARLRSFVRADLARYRAALPGTAAGYLDQLEAALATGYLPVPADLSALRILSTRPASPPETARRKTLLRRAQAARIPQVRHSQDDRPDGRVPAVRTPSIRTPAVRTGAVPIPAVRAAEEGEQEGDGPEPSPKRKAKPSPGPAKPGPAERPGSPEPTPSRPVPTPAEVFPPRRRQPSAPSSPPPPPPSEPAEEPDTEQGATAPQRLAVPA